MPSSQSFILATLDFGYEADTADDRTGEDSRDQDHNPVRPCKYFTRGEGTQLRMMPHKGRVPWHCTRLAHSVAVDNLRFPIAGATSPGCIQKQNRKHLTGLACTHSRTTIPPVIPFVTPSLFTLVSRMPPITGSELFHCHYHSAFGSCLLRVSWSFGHCQCCETPLAFLSDWQWSVTPLALNFCSVC